MPAVTTLLSSPPLPDTSLRLSSPGSAGIVWKLLIPLLLDGVNPMMASFVTAIVLTVLPEALREVADYRMLAYSVLLIVIMLLNASPKFAELKGCWSIGNILRMRKANKDVKVLDMDRNTLVEIEVRRPSSS